MRQLYGWEAIDLKQIKESNELLHTVYTTGKKWHGRKFGRAEFWQKESLLE